MKRSLGVGSKMSNYQYGSKKTVWKWTTGKILAFSAFGVVVAGLIYTETSTSNSINQETVSINDGDFQNTSAVDFDQEYQEFLKKGKKVVPQYTIDSGSQIAQTSSPTVEPVRTPTSNSSSTRVTRQAQVEQTEPDRAPSLSNSNNSTNNKAAVENNLKPVPLTPANNQSSQNIGTLEEIEPVDQALSGNQVSSQSPGNTEEVIVEEFYTEDLITGTISALSDRTPLSGVEITVKGTDIKSVTDSNGKYSIKVPGDPLYRTVRYSYQGNSTERDVAPGTEILNIRF